MSSMHVYVTNRTASGVPYQAGPMLTSIPSTNGAVYPSAVAGHFEKLIRALAEESQYLLQLTMFHNPLTKQCQKQLYNK